MFTYLAVKVPKPLITWGSFCQDNFTVLYFERWLVNAATMVPALKQALMNLETKWTRFLENKGMLFIACTANSTHWYVGWEPWEIVPSIDIWKLTFKRKWILHNRWAIGVGIWSRCLVVAYVLSMKLVCIRMDLNSSPWTKEGIHMSNAVVLHYTSLWHVSGWALVLWSR